MINKLRNSQNNYELFTKINNNNYFRQKSQIKEEDKLYFCELELYKTKWTKLEGNLTDYDLVLNKIYSLFEPYFKVENVWFDDIGYLIFKIQLIASKKGIVPSFIELGIFIEVIDINHCICNEVKKNYLLYDIKNEIQCRVGDNFVFYLSKNKHV